MPPAAAQKPGGCEASQPVAYNADMTEFPFNWKRPAGQALELALNRALALDPDTQSSLRALHGQRVTLALMTPPLALQMHVEGERLCVGPVDDAKEADLGVRADWGGLLGQLPFLREAKTKPKGKLRIEGDAQLAQRLQKLVGQYNPDWQLPFVQVFGDVLGVQIANAVAAAFKQAQHVGKSLAENAAEYVTEESRDVVGKAELDAFHDDVDALRDDVERVAAKIARLRSSRVRA